MKKQKIYVRGTEVVIFSEEKQDYISLTDIAKYKDSERSDYILQNWMRNRSTIEFIGLWEQLHNPDFNSIEFDGFKNEAGSNSFSLTPKRWIAATNAIDIISKVLNNADEKVISVAVPNVIRNNIQPHLSPRDIKMSLIDKAFIDRPDIYPERGRGIGHLS